MLSLFGGLCCVDAVSLQHLDQRLRRRRCRGESQGGSLWNSLESCVKMPHQEASPAPYLCQCYFSICVGWKANSRDGRRPHLHVNVRVFLQLALNALLVSVCRMMTVTFRKMDAAYRRAR